MVSRNEAGPVQEFTVLLRAVGTELRATEMLYLAAEMLRPGRNATDRAVNHAIIILTTRMLGLRDADPEMVERVLRSLPKESD